MSPSNEPHYREFLLRYAESARKRKPSFSYGSWAKALGLKSTSSLTKVLNGEREAGPELVERLVKYFKFSSAEAVHFRELVSVSKLKNHEELKSRLLESLLASRNAETLTSRLVEFDRYELLSEVWHLAVRELARLPKMTVSRLEKILPARPRESLEKSLNLLSRLGLVKRDPRGAFVAAENSVRTAHEFPSEAIRAYHRQSLDLARSALDDAPPAERDFQSLTLLVDSDRLEELKKRLRDFMDTLEARAPSTSVDRLYQVQFQLFPTSERFKKTDLSSIDPPFKGDPE